MAAMCPICSAGPVVSHRGDHGSEIEQESLQCEEPARGRAAETTETPECTSVSRRDTTWCMYACSFNLIIYSGKGGRGDRRTGMCMHSHDSLCVL